MLTGKVFKELPPTTRTFIIPQVGEAHLFPAPEYGALGTGSSRLRIKQQRMVVVAQQALPDSVLTSEFATGRAWHTNYWITVAMALLTLTLSWRMRGIPWPHRP